MWDVNLFCRVVLFLAGVLGLFVGLSYLVVGWGNRAAKKEKTR